jgi:hypothetical protein
MQLINALLGSFFNKKEGSIEIKNKKEIYSYSEKIRAAAAMELIDMALKIKLGNALVSRICAGEGIAADFWALGRIGARHLLYGSLAYVVPREICEKWVLKLIQSRLPADEKLSFLIGQLARKTEHREINVSADLANKALLRFSEGAHQERLSDLLLKENFLTQGEQEQIFGDKLPAGLLLELDIASTSR